MIEGRDAFAIAFLNDPMWRSAQRFGTTGIASLARSAIDLALGALKGKIGQHFAFAMPEASPCEVVVRSPAGLPPDQAMRTPGVPVAKNGKIIPSNAPGFGFEFSANDFARWSS